MEQSKLYCYKYPRPAITTDCVIWGWAGKELQVLLVERGGEPFRGCWALPVVLWVWKKMLILVQRENWRKKPV